MILSCRCDSVWIYVVYIEAKNICADTKISNSFSVPYDLSMDGRNEPWAEAFWVEVQAKWERCKQVWRSMQMEVNECYPQAIAL